MMRDDFSCLLSSPTPSSKFLQTIQSHRYLNERWFDQETGACEKTLGSIPNTSGNGLVNDNGTLSWPMIFFSFFLFQCPMDGLPKVICQGLPSPKALQNLNLCFGFCKQKYTLSSHYKKYIIMLEIQKILGFALCWKYALSSHYKKYIILVLINIFFFFAKTNFFLYQNYHVI